MAAVCGSRTIGQVTEVAEAAGLNSCHGPAQVLTFSQNFMNEEYKLMELPADVLECFHQGERLVIRGDTQDDAVLCTENATFDLKLADTSNIMLLCQNVLLPKMAEFDCAGEMVENEICGCLSAYYELKHQQPKLQKLKILLEETAYRGPSFEKEINLHDLKKYTLEDLREKVQASERELQEGLRNLEALEVDGFWRILECDYREKVVVSILNLIDENSWSYNHVPLKETCDVLEELEPRFIVAHCFRCFGEKVSMDTQQDDTERYYKLSEDKVCRFYAEYLLRPAGRFNYHEFMESWKQSVPEGMHADDDHLLGLALSDMNSEPPVIWHFPKDNLPSDPAMRFNKLFKTRTKWTIDEIRPYLVDLESPSQSLKSLLMKFARCSTDVTGAKVYNSKRPIS